MDTPTVSLFLAICALLALTGSAIGLVTLAASRVAPRSPVAAWRADLAPVALPLAAVVAVVTTLGSLYYSEVADFTPCVLCWYQRIAAYPLAVILTIAALRRDHGIRLYAAALAFLGLVVATYHSYLQWFPPPTPTSFCTADAPCTERWVHELGFVTLPFMAWACFVAVLVAMALAGPDPADSTASPPEESP